MEIQRLTIQEIEAIAQDPIPREGLFMAHDYKTDEWLVIDTIVKTPLRRMDDKDRAIRFLEMGHEKRL